MVPVLAAMATGFVKLRSFGSKYGALVSEQASLLMSCLPEENTETSIDIKRLGDLGSIKVTAQRVTVMSWLGEKKFAGEGHQSVAEVSEKMLKGKAISNAVA